MRYIAIILVMLTPFSTYAKSAADDDAQLFDKDAFQPETRNKKMSYKEFKFEKDAFTSKPKVFEEKPNANRPPVKEEPLTELSRSEVHARSAKFVEPAPKKKTKNFTVSLRRPKGK